MLAISNRLFDRLLPFDSAMENLVRDGNAWKWQCYAPPADIREEEASYVIELDVPGLTDKDIQLTLENKHLAIKGERKPVEKAYSRQERAFGTFERVFHLPEDADGARIEAVAKNGVLTVTVPKLESAKARTITVKGE